jgi:hypothetical protein
VLRCALLVLLLASGACRAPEVRPDGATVDPVPPRLTSAAPPVAPVDSAAGARRDPLPPAPEPSASATAEPAPTASAAPGGPCSIKVTALIEASVSRGVHRSPMREATMDRLSPEERSRWHSRDHGVTYLLCRYAVTMNGKRFTYDHVAGQEMPTRGQLDTAQCSLPAEMRKVEADLRQTTKQCSDPHAGAYWGFDLVAVP